MKKIVAILLALALVSTTAFAQWLSNTVSTKPVVSIDGTEGNYWQFDPVLQEAIEGGYTTPDGRAQIQGGVAMKLNWVEKTAHANILSFSPRWQFSKVGCTWISGYVKPFDNLKILLNDGDNVGGPGIKWVDCSWVSGLKNPGSTSNGTGGIIGVTYSLLDEHLQIMGGIANGGVPTGKPTGSWIKKGAYGPFNLGVKFKISDDISVGAKWQGQFGGFNGGVGDTDNTDKTYQAHGFHVAADLNMFQDAKIGTKIGVGFSFTTDKASKIMNDNKKTTEFAGTVLAGFKFTTGVKDDVWLTVGWRNYDGKKTKVLPFAVGNTLTYSVSSDATFTLDTSYAQGAMTMKKKAYDKGEVLGAKEADGVIAALNTATLYGGVIHIKPSFEFKLSKHTFNFGVETDVFNRLYHWNKTNNDWAYTAAKGIYAKVAMPISWKYSF